VRERVSAARGAWLLTRLRARRLLNQLVFAYSRPIGGTKGRTATPAKRRNPWLITGFVGVTMLFSFGGIARQTIVNLHVVLDRTSQGRLLPLSRLPEFSDALTRGLSMDLTLLFLVTVLMTLGVRELAQPDWDLEWLVTLPARLRALLWSRVIERSVATPAGLAFMGPTCVLIAWFSHYRLGALAIGILALLPLVFLAAMIRTLIDTGLRLALPPSRLRNLQAVNSIVGIVLLYSAMSLGTGRPGGYLFDLARDFPAWALWLPPGLTVRLLSAPDGQQALAWGALLYAESAVLLAAGIAALEYQLRNGVVAASARESARGSTATVARNRVERERRGMRWIAALGSPVQRRELRLLGRDRNYLVQTLVLPVVIIFGQMLVNGRLHGISTSGLSAPAVAGIAFGIAAYMLMLSAFQTLNSEGGALWILFTVPQPVGAILYEKAQLWSMLALIYPLAVFSVGFATSMVLDWQALGLVAVVLLGVPIYGAIAVSLGVFGCDPLATEVQSRVRSTFVYLFMMLAGLYSYAIFAGEWSRKLVLIALSALLAVALWQKAKDELPYLLDPGASPPARVSTADGIVGAMLFFVLQGIIAFALKDARGPLTAFQLMVAFSVAGALTYGAMRFTFWRTHATGVPSILGDRGRIGSLLAWGGAAGLVAGCAGLVYGHLWPPAEGSDDAARWLADLSRSAWFFALAVVAAPLCEEFIFRGLIFGGLRRSLSAPRAIFGSAVVFAIVHPPAAMIPVFGLGICAAFAYQRARGLLAPMVAHAVYNAMILGWQVGLH